MTKIIAIEGIDGSGKTVQVTRLERALQQRGFRTQALSFPVYDSFFGSQIGNFLSGAESVSADSVDAKSMALWFAMDRYAALHDFTTNADFLLLNRYVLSNAVYQSIRERDQADMLNYVLELEHQVLRLPVPDLYFFLDMDTESAGSNVEKKGFRDYVGTQKDVYERQEGIQSRARSKYLAYAKQLDNVCVISCMQNGVLLAEDQIGEKILSALEERNLLSMEKENRS